MKKVLTVLSVVFVLVMVFFCSGAVSAADKLKVALVLPGKADDVSFNQAMYRGAMALTGKGSENSVSIFLPSPTGSKPARMTQS